jgi:polar amino acid transport system substrate-binding protein
MSSTMKSGLAVVLCVLFMHAARADSVRVATDENLPPYSFTQGGVAVGIDVDMLRAAAAQLPLEITVVALPWKRVLHYVENGEVPLAMPLFKTPEREQFAIFSAPVHYSLTSLFARSNSASKFNALSDLHGRNVGYNRGFVLPEQIEKAIKKRTISAEEVSTTTQNVAKLMAGRIDLFVANVENTQFILRGTPARNEIVQLPRLLAETRPAYLVFSKAAGFKANDPIIAALNLSLEKLHRDGTYDRIVRKYTQ